MNSIWIALGTTTVAFVAVSLGVFAVERLSRTMLFGLLGATLALDLMLAQAGMTRTGLGNALVVTLAVPIGAWIASLIRDRRALVAVLVMAAIYDLVDSLSGRAISSATGGPDSLLVVRVAHGGRSIAPLTLTDLVVLAMVLSCMARFDVPRTLSHLACLTGILAPVALDPLLGAGLARVPFLAVCGVVGAARVPAPDS